MRILGVEPGPIVGKAWKHLKELRLDRGPLGRDEAVAELLRWAAEQGIEVPESNVSDSSEPAESSESASGDSGAEEGGTDSGK